MHHIPIRGFLSLSTLRQGARLAGLLRDLRVDVVHSHDVYSNIFAGYSASTMTRCRIIESRRWWLEVPRRALATANRWSYRRADRVLANCSAVARLLQTTEGVPARKIVEIPNFLGDEAFVAIPQEEVARQRAAWGLPPAAFVVGTVARLAPVKNLGMLIRALADLGPSIHAVLIGSGPSETELRRLADELGVSARVRFAGEIRSTGNLHSYFDLSVLCSRSEGFPNSIIEAMALARPIVATPVGGVTDVIEHERTGLLVPVGDSAELARAISRLHADAGLRKALGARARAVAASGYRREAVIDRLGALYASLAGHLGA